MELTKDEWQLIAEALYACAPTGGGSDQFHLSNKICSAMNLQVREIKVGHMQMRIYDEVKDHCDLGEGERG